MNSFQELELPESLSRAIEKLNFVKPTPIQAQAIPVAMSGKDLIGCAKTGTGKTVAFALPSLAKCIQHPSERVLILAPTRELACQIQDVIRDLTRFSSNLRSCLLIGGAGMGSQLKSLRARPAFVVATPGRLLDHVERRSLHLQDFGTVILDEADRMLDMGFAPAIEEIFSKLPQKRQTLLFSATLPPKILKLTKTYMNEPVQIFVNPESVTAENIKTSFLKMQHAEKNESIVKELEKNTGSTLIFARTKIRTDRLAKLLNKSGLPAECIHGGRTQSQRTKALSRFRSGACRILVATDVASRGIDVPNIQLVVNFDLPQSREDYVHRIGRTARAGASGEALSFVAPDEMRHWKILEGGASESESKGASGRTRFKPRATGFRFFSGRNSKSSGGRPRRAGGFRG